MSNTTPSMEKKRNHIRVIRGASAANATSAMTGGVIDTFTDVSADSYRTPAEMHEAQRVTARDAGYNEGLAQARADIAAATEDANNRVRHALNALQSAIDGFDQRDAVAVADIESVIATVALEVAAEILQHEVAAASNPGADALARALQLAPNRGEAIAFLHPQDADTLGMNAVDARGRTVEIVADTKIERGGCLISIGDTRIDAQLSTALQRVRIALDVDDAQTLGNGKRFLDESVIAEHEAKTYVKKIESVGTKGTRSKASRKASSEAPNE